MAGKAMIASKRHALASFAVASAMVGIGMIGIPAQSAVLARPRSYFPLASSQPIARMAVLPRGSRSARSSTSGLALAATRQAPSPSSGRDWPTVHSAAGAQASASGTSSSVIQPGIEILASDSPPSSSGISFSVGGGTCTLGWLFNDYQMRVQRLHGRSVRVRVRHVLAATAAHCVQHVGEPVWTLTQIAGEVDYVEQEDFGRVAFIPTEWNLQKSESYDYALIEIAPTYWNELSPAMAGHPQIPAVVATSTSARRGDLVQLSGYGVGFGATQPTQQDREGVFDGFFGTTWWALASATPGDSGGPIADVTDGKGALGIVDVVGLCSAAVLDTAPCASPAGGVGGVSVQFILQDAAAHGFPIRLWPV